LTDTHTGSVGEPQVAASPHAASPKVFINYRHEDAQEAAVRLYEMLADQLGAEHVFLDVKSMGEGTRWLEAIRQAGAHGSVFLALIGRSWLTTLKEREAVTAGAPEDYVALELSMALDRWPGRVIPVLLQDAEMPGEEWLPRRIVKLAQFQAFAIRPLSFEQDAKQLLAGLGAAAREPEPVPEELRRRIVPIATPTTPAPDRAHYDEVLSFMTGTESFVPVLGSGVRGSLPDARVLASHLAEKFKLGSVPPDLAEVAQRVMVLSGPDPLNDEIAAVLRPEPEPDETHRFLARLPRRLEQLGLRRRYQMILTTNYDSALEEAFNAADEPYDLVVYLANGMGDSETGRGKFLHVPSTGEPQVIDETRDYHKLPLNEDYEPERTVIVKINGAAAGGVGSWRWDRNSVLTEDQYIGYLVTNEMVTVVPVQILIKLRRSHCLFLGYEVQDWSLRVFLKRIWRGQALPNRSWAIEHQPEALEKDLWRSLKVDLLASSPDAYVNELDARLDAWRASGA
jgi:hypothetical protein